MPILAVYTEPLLVQLLHDTLGQVADALGLSPGGDDDARGSYAEAVTDTILAYYGDDYVAGDNLTGATDLQRLRTLARREAWRLAAGRSAGEFDFTSAGTSESRSQLYKQIAAQLTIAEAQAQQYDASTGSVVYVPIRRVDDPYTYLPDEARVLP